MTAGTSVESERAAVGELLALAKGQEFGSAVPPALAALAGADFAESLRLQLAVLAAWEDEGHRVGGWKIGLTSRAAKDSMGDGVRPHGYVLTDRILDSGAKLAEPVPHCRLEPEVGLTLATDLAGEDVTVEQARAAVASIHPAFEINSGRVPKGSSLAVRLGNALNNWGIVFGPAQPVDAVDLAGLTVELGNEHGTVAEGGSASANLDDPFLSLTRVCRALAHNGRGLSAGQRLITGSLTPAVPTDGARHFYADFGPLGRVELDLA
jgi:2-keto-4-pentenoate hydratase